MADDSKPLFNDYVLTLNEVDITHKLNERPARAPNYEVEANALRRLTRKFLDPKAKILQELTDIILEITGAGSAGISLEEKNEGEDVFRWHATSGEFKHLIGTTLPRNFSPCGVVVEKKAYLLVEKPIRHWGYIENLGVPLYEVLLVPFYRNDKAVGTLWAVSHRADKLFDLEDRRLLSSMCDLAALAVESTSRMSVMTTAHDKASDERNVSVLQQQWLRDVINHIPKPLFFFNLDTQSLWFTNNAAKKMLGLVYEDEFETAPGTARLKVTTVDGQEVSEENLPSRRSLRGETINGEEFILYTSSGRFHINIFAEQIPSSHGQPRSALILFQDISTLKAAENTLLQTKAELKEAVDIAHIGFWSMEVSSRKVTLTPILMQQFGLDPTTFTGNLDSAIDLIDPEDRPMVTDAINRAVTNHTPYQIEYRVRHKDGSIRWIEAKGAIINDLSGQPVRFAGTTIDITDSVHARQEIDNARLNAETANQIKSQFLANMSHEIRTPLGAIMGFSDLARQPGVTSEEIANYLGIIDRNSVQVLRIIDDILDLAKVESGRVELEKMDFSLLEFIAEFTSLIGFRARENAIAFNINVHTDMPNIICADPTRLRQILTNAVGNAIKFTGKGKITLDVCYKDGILEFGIEDTGRGISKEQADGLFKPFVQADASTTRKFGGTGLGLVLTKKLCQLMGGDYVLVRSEIDKGSKFLATVNVTLPAHSQLIAKEKVIFEATGVNVAAAKTDQLKKINVLLVEDSPDNQILIRLILERQGVQLEIANDGFAGVESALKKDYDVVLMDIQMPRMDGHEAVQTLRSKGYKKPIIALTAHAMKEESERARISGFTDFLSKPIHRESLIKMVSDYANKPTQ